MHVRVHKLQSFCRLRGTAGKWATMMLSTNTGLTKPDLMSRIIVKLLNKFLLCNPLLVLFTEMSISSVPQLLCAVFSSHIYDFLSTVFQVVEIANACGKSNYFLLLVQNFTALLVESCCLSFNRDHRKTKQNMHSAQRRAGPLYNKELLYKTKDY